MQAVNNLNKGVVIAIAAAAIILAVVMGFIFLRGNSSAAGPIRESDKPDYMKQMDAGQKPMSYGQQYGQRPGGSGGGAPAYGRPGGSYGYGGGPSGGYGGSGYTAPR
jgi:uncharacterized membrane protein YgcG